MIYKIILLWITIVSTALLLIGGFESLITSGQWLSAIIWVLVNLELILVCRKTLSVREFYKFSGARTIDRLFGL